jgi:hypothetical protein
MSGNRSKSLCHLQSIASCIITHMPQTYCYQSFAERSRLVSLPPWSPVSTKHSAALVLKGGFRLVSLCREIHCSPCVFDAILSHNRSDLESIQDSPPTNDAGLLASDSSCIPRIDKPSACFQPSRRVQNTARNTHTASSMATSLWQPSLYRLYPILKIMD